ncbi:MAG: pyruvate formate lyase family protein, partial [Candidatus Scatosoma sp.]
MSTCQLLKDEISEKPEGVFMPHYYKYLGYRKDYSLPRTAARAEAVEALFTLPEAYIYKNDLIAGSIRPLFLQKTEAETEHAASVCNSFGDRDFSHNADHYSPDYAAFLQGGIPALLKQIDDSLAWHADTERRANLTAMKKSAEALRQRVLLHAEKARELIGTPGYDDTRLNAIARNCSRIADFAPETFEEALQLVWLTHICFLYEGRYAMALGRMDQYLYTFYKKDKKAGRLTDAAATELLENVFMKIYERRAFLDSDDVVNICIGGTARNGACRVNELSYCILHAVKNVRIPGPNLSARIGEDTPDCFLDECLQVIGTGLGYPALMNDKVNLAALSAYGYEPDDV